ncbi:MAG: hypothetical protein PHP20_10200 [Firmicutes bacterium]|jgi:type II secretory pathway pseudopilin PulG|nr:hypothetical protein [Bacillota bacterium]MDD4337640.1 hypothetical protein [Bacillota bacterium]MDD4793422.1 hypothetical protein [Bacillota bacterium]
MAMRSRQIASSFGCPTSAAGRRLEHRAEAGITLIELMLVITMMGFAFAAVFALTQLTAATNAIVDKGVRYSQELSLMSDQIVDGAGSRYKGLRQASNVSSDYELGHVRYNFHYTGTSDQEHYWVSEDALFRSINKEPAERMGPVSSVEVSGPDHEGICTLRLVSSNGEGNEVEHVTSVRLRNRS